MALEAGEDGLVFYRALAQHYQNALCPGGALVLEIGWQQREAVTALLAEYGWADIRCIQDFGGNDRCVICPSPKINWKKQTTSCCNILILCYTKKESEGQPALCGPKG